MVTDTSQAYHQLHQLLQKLADAEQALSLGPKRVALAEKKIAAGEHAVADKREQIKLLRKESDQKSLTLRSREAELQKLNVRLNEASSNKEYDIIQAQISARRQEDASLEDDILGLLSQVDEAGQELEAAEAQVVALRTKQQEIRSEFSSRQPELEAEIAKLRAEIDGAESIVPGEGMATYRRLRSAQGATALAVVDDGYCTECNTGVTAQDGVRLNLGEFVLCRACGRILYVFG